MKLKELLFLEAARRRPGDPFHADGRSLEFTIGDFWAWSSSDVLSNTLRGIVAEYRVAQALGVADGVRTEWEPYDVRTSSGVTVEVKSAAYIQSWAQRGPSQPSFGIAPTVSWDARTNTWGTERRRQAEVYVFALLAHRDKESVDPLDVAQWEFFVLPTAVLDERVPQQKSIGLNSLLSLGPARCSFAGLAQAVEKVAAASDPRRHGNAALRR